MLQFLFTHTRMVSSPVRCFMHGKACNYDLNIHQMYHSKSGAPKFVDCSSIVFAVQSSFCAFTDWRFHELETSQNPKQLWHKARHSHKQQKMQASRDHCSAFFVVLSLLCRHALKKPTFTKAVYILATPLHCHIGMHCVMVDHLLWRWWYWWTL